MKKTIITTALISAIVMAGCTSNVPVANPTTEAETTSAPEVTETTATSGPVEEVAYGTYSSEGEASDSLIRATLTVEDGKVTSAVFDDMLIPVANGGAAGIAELDDETKTALGDMVIEANDKAYPTSMKIGDYVFTAKADDKTGVAYTAEIDGKETELMTYIITKEGGDWYCSQDKAEFLDKDGNVVGEAKIQTKKDINHGEDFWPSDLHFNGNIEALEKFVVENGLDYDLSQMVQNDDHVWVVADAVTGATLAGAPNYLRIAQEAAK